MVEIMLCMHKYVPTISKTIHLEVARETDTQARADYFHTVLFGGVMTSLRWPGHVVLRISPFMAAAGTLFVCEDWHARVVLQSVSHLMSYFTHLSVDSCRVYGKTCTTLIPVEMVALWCN